MEGLTIPKLSKAGAGVAPAGPEKEAGRSLLPAFATPDWLRENHHLMRADLRKLAVWLGQEHADWPAEADGTDEAAFWRTVHGFAQRWTWFLWQFEDRIEKTFGRVKGGRKLLGPRVLRAASEKAQSLRPFGPGTGDATIFDDLETLWQAREVELVAQSVWVLFWLEGPEGRLIATSWLVEPEIEALVGDGVRSARYSVDPERGNLVERLLGEPAGAQLEGLAAQAEAMSEALRGEMDEAWDHLREHVAAHEDYGAAEERLSYLLFGVESLFAALEELEDARREALARCRHASLRALLQETLDALPETRFADSAHALKERVSELLADAGLPLGFPDSEWERCRELAERFRAEIVEPGERERALQEASRRYVETASASNLEALQAAAEAVRVETLSSEPDAVLDAIGACLGDLVGQFGSMADRGAGDGDGTAPGSKDRARGLHTEIEELKEANREAEERIATLSQAVEDAGEENDGLRRERHRLQQRIAALEGVAPPETATEDRGAPPPASYAELPAWTARHFDGRVALAGRALRALKGAEFENVALVGRAIGLLGGSYWRMKTEGGGELREAFDGELSALRLLETPSLSRDRQGKARDDFTVEWNGRRLTLDRHLKTASITRDPRYCFRLYFVWDDEDRQVVIGHLPGHMKT